MTLTKRNLAYYAVACLVAIGIALAFSAHVATANPLVFSSGVKSAAATTSPQYITTVGTNGTTTPLVYDSQEVNGTNQTNTGNTFVPDSVTLLVQFAASSSVSVLNICAEYSMDSQDWYQDNLASSTAVNGNISGKNCIQWTFASSTTGGTILTATNGATSTKAVTFPVPTRYVRFIGSISGTNAAGAVWWQAVPKKQAK